MTIRNLDLTDEQIDEVGARLDEIRSTVMSDLGAEDAAYIRRLIAIQRGLEVAARGTLMFSLLPPAWLAGTAMLSLSKIIENMELGHNIMHGQWDWMRDPRIHSTTWEWDSFIPADDWKKTHNSMHHTYTNVIGKDSDVGYGRLRVTEEQPWEAQHLIQLPVNAVIALGFEFGIAMYDAQVEAAQSETDEGRLGALRRVWKKIRPQVVKDYVAFPLLSGISAPTTLLANLTASVTRNVWTHTIIFCGHFPDEVVYFTEEDIVAESRGEWYLRQLQGSANIEGSPLFHIMTGNLSHQIEHHLFPDMPSNRYAEVAPQVRALCQQYGLPYTTGRLSRQNAQVWRTLAALSVPDSIRESLARGLPTMPSRSTERSALPVHPVAPTAAASAPTRVEASGEAPRQTVKKAENPAA
ncbi:MAG: NADPH-dependent stearoyl-CoA 9-desaturase [Actinomycetota bacterium]|nr:NADPH-dependent stearoyl-CoA 9-desaturase [Actinomycetota bacterium]